MDRLRNKKIKYIVFSCISLLVFITTVVYAAISSNFSVSGSVNKKGNTWNIKFTNLDIDSVTGSAKSESAKVVQTDSGVDMINVSASLTQPGDSVTYTFTVNNAGTLDAKLSSYDVSDFMTGSNLQNAFIIGSLTYADGSDLSIGDVLSHGASANLKVTLRYTGSSPISDNDLFFSFNLTLTYTQI